MAFKPTWFGFGMLTFLVFLVVAPIISNRQHTRTISDILTTAKGHVIVLDDGRRFLVPPSKRPYNAHAVGQFKVRQKVYVIWTNAVWNAVSEGCWDISVLGSQKETDRLGGLVVEVEDVSVCAEALLGGAE